MLELRFKISCSFSKAMFFPMCHAMDKRLRNINGSHWVEGSRNLTCLLKDEMDEWLEMQQEEKD